MGPITAPILIPLPKAPPLLPLLYISEGFVFCMLSSFTLLSLAFQGFKTQEGACSFGLRCANNGQMFYSRPNYSSAVNDQLPYELTSTPVIFGVPVSGAPAI